MRPYAQWFDLFLKIAIGELMLSAKENPVEDVPDAEFVASETLGEVIDKLIILNIRIWHLEDDKANATTDAELGAIQRKLQSCFRSKRPRLVAALNKMMAAAIRDGRLDLLDDEYVKSYKE